MAKKILITGGTGMIGTALTKHLVQHGNEVMILTRNPQKAWEKSPFGKEVSYVFWDLKKQDMESAAIRQANAVVHLAGAGVVDKPWTKAYKKQILESRTLSSQLLVKAMRENANDVETVVSQSAIGYYGPDQTPGHAFIESDPADKGFLGDTCVAWENSIRPVEALGKRLVIFRTGIVLSRKGGVLAEFKKPLLLRVAGILGDGKQVVSWIHIKDECRLFEYAIQNNELRGVFNAVAPHPVTNEALTLAYAKATHGNGYLALHVPEVALKLALGKRSMEVLKSATISANKIQSEGFVFQFPELGEALKNLAS